MSSSRDPDRAFFGHPAGLSTLFFTEMWERFSYYGMRAFLIFYMLSPVSHGGRGMGDAAGGIVIALYQSSVYMLSLPGGWIADRFLGQRRAVTFGGLGIMTGNILLALPISDAFFPGLAMIALGTGLLKPNVSTLVGQLYKPNDIRRDAGFTIYYMGINIGAWAAPIACGFLAQSDTFRDFLAGHGIDPNLCWHIAFGAAAVGMLAGLIQYTLGGKRLGQAGLHPTVPTDPAEAARGRMILTVILGALAAIIVGAVIVAVTGIDISKDLIGNVFGIGLLVGAVALFIGMLSGARDAGEKTRVIAMIPLFLGGVAFFATFEQASTTLNLFAERVVREVVPSSYYQTINATFIVFLAPVAAGIWVALGRKNREPSSVSKFAIGMIFTAFAFIVLLPTLDAIASISSTTDSMTAAHASDAAIDAATSGMRVSPVFLLLLYFFQTASELCISPVGLSSMSKLAPQRMAGMVMGTWFLATAIGNYLAGRAAGFTASRGFGFLFWVLIIASFAVAAALFAVAPIIKRMMGPEAPVVPSDVDLPVATAVKVGDPVERD